jgi:alpha-amylase
MISKTSPPKKHDLILYFQVHQPYRLGKFEFFDIGSEVSYSDDQLNEKILQRIVAQCYLPTNRLLHDLIQKHPEIKLAFSISGTALDQFEKFAPEVLLSFKDLASTGSVEYFAETYYHSLASILPGKEFELQVVKHQEAIYKHFNVLPTVFRNTELIYSNDIGKRVHNLGFKGIVTDGIERILFDRSPHHLYCHPDLHDLKIFLRNYRLSDDIAFRFAQGLTLDQYMSWLSTMPETEKLITLALDYETFGEHQKKQSGILSFLEDLLVNIAQQADYRMVMPSDILATSKVHSQLFVPDAISWADQERDLSAWLGNDMQREAFDLLRTLGKTIYQINSPELLHTWRQLQTSDHFYYMCTKKEDDGNVHSYFSPYASPYEAFINYMNVLSDFSLKVRRTFKKINQTKRKNFRSNQLESY